MFYDIFCTTEGLKSFGELEEKENTLLEGWVLRPILWIDFQNLR